MQQVRYIIAGPKLIDTLDFDKRRGKHKVYLTKKEGIRYNKNKLFFQRKKGIIKFRGIAPKELEGYTQYNTSEILKIVNSSWGQWKLN